MQNKHLQWLIPLLLMVCITPWISEIDLAVTRLFYRQGEGIFHFSSHPFFKFMYMYGVVPADLTVGAAVIVLLLSYCSAQWKQYRRPALLLVSTLAIGAGLITHLILKDHWGRPRPKQVIEFGGSQPFRPYYQPNFFHQPEPSKSFPCGHCTMGFYFFTLFFLGKRLKNPYLANMGLLLAAALGIALSVARIAQGGHFLSDTLMGALVMWMTAWALDDIIFSRSMKEEVN